MDTSRLVTWNDYLKWPNGKIKVFPLGPEMEPVAKSIGGFASQISDSMRIWREINQRRSALRAGISFDKAPQLGPGKDV